jgi:hypothetical protein
MGSVLVRHHYGPTGVSYAMLSALRDAYVRGDYGAVLDLQTAVRIGEPVPAEAWLLRARALLRLRRPEDVATELAPVIPTIRNTDERLTAEMLHGAALARLAPAHGIAVLAAIADTAQRERAHPAVCAEIAYFRAVAHWSADELDEAEELAREAQRNGSDIRSVLAMQLRAWIAATRPTDTRYADALAVWRAAGQAYARCQERDLDLATMILQQIASLHARGPYIAGRASNGNAGNTVPAALLRRRLAFRTRR